MKIRRVITKKEKKVKIKRFSWKTNKSDFRVFDAETGQIWVVGYQTGHLSVKVISSTSAESLCSLRGVFTLGETKPSTSSFRALSVCLSELWWWPPSMMGNHSSIHLCCTHTSWLAPASLWLLLSLIWCGLTESKLSSVLKCKFSGCHGFFVVFNESGWVFSFDLLMISGSLGEQPERTFWT